MKYEKSIIKTLQTIEPSLKYILSDRDGVEPIDPYVIVSVIDLVKQGVAIRGVVSSTPKESISAICEVTYQITLHAKATDIAHDVFDTVHLGMESSFYSNTFYENGLGVLRVENLLYISQPVDTVNYKRATFDLVCLVERYDEFNTTHINSVEVDGELKDDEGNIHMLHIKEDGI